MSLFVRDAQRDGTTVSLRVADGRIVALGPDATAEPRDEVLDASGLALLPGLVNGHAHAAMTLFRGFAGDLPLQEWLGRVWPVESQLTDDDVYWGTRLACLEMVRTGTVRFWDMYWQPPAVARAVIDSGLRAAVCGPIIDGLDDSKAPEVRAAVADELDVLAGFGPRVTPTLGPHAIYTVSESSLRAVAELAAERDVPVHIHFAETETEVAECVAAHGIRPAAYLDRCGLLSPSTVLAHGVWVDDGELALVAKRGSTLVTNPVSNLKLAVGDIFPYRAARERDIPVGLGTDGAASNNSLDLLADVKVLALLQKHRERDPAVLPAEDALATAMGAHAPLLGAVGELAVGGPADFLLARADALQLAPGHLVANLVYATGGDVVDTTVVDGTVVMRHREVADEDEVRAKATEVARRLGTA